MSIVAAPAFLCHDGCVRPVAINGIPLDEFDSSDLSSLEREALAADALQQLIKGNVGHIESDYHFVLLDKIRWPSAEADSVDR